MIVMTLGGWSWLGSGLGLALGAYHPRKVLKKKQLITCGEP